MKTAIWFDSLGVSMNLGRFSGGTNSLGAARPTGIGLRRTQPDRIRKIWTPADQRLNDSRQRLTADATSSIGQLKEHDVRLFTCAIEHDFVAVTRDIEITDDKSASKRRQLALSTALEID